MQVLTVNYTDSKAPELFCKSLKETGFAVLTHHPISPQSIEDLYQQWQQFFSSEEKFNYRPEKKVQDGYFPFKTENAKDSKISDLKEFFHFYPNGRVPEDLHNSTLQMYSALSTFGAELLQWIESYLPEEISKQLSMPLRRMVVDSPNTLLRILHYPPLNDDAEPGAVRSAPHEDINLITLLPAATAPGLEVLDVQGNWHAVNCDPGNLVVNVGDMLQMCTQHYYKSTTHRVVNPMSQGENTSRYSMPLFLHARKEVKVSPELTAEEYLVERLRAIGIY